MAIFTLEQDNYAQIRALLADDNWLIACLCAAWCDVCKGYRPAFEQWAAQQPDKHFLWIDVEDRADLVGDIDVDNFPTLLLQHGDTVAFFGPTMPEVKIAQRMLDAYTSKSAAELQAEATSSAERRAWQAECNLRQRLEQA